MKKKSQISGEAAAVDAYVASLPEHRRVGLERLRNSIAAAAPGAQPGISYGIPCFKLNGRPLVWFAAFKEHSSFFPGATAIRMHAAELKRYKTSKGTLQFPPDRPPPPKLIAKLVKTRIAELQKTRTRTTRKPSR